MQQIQRYSFILGLLAFGCGDSGRDSTTSSAAIVPPPTEIASYNTPVSGTGNLTGATTTDVSTAPGGSVTGGTGSGGTIPSSGTTAPGAGTAPTGGTTPASTPNVVNFTVDNFGSGQVATALVRNMPDSESSGTANGNVVASKVLQGGRDRDPAVLQNELEQLSRISPKVAARGVQGKELLHRFQQLGRGDAATFFISETSINANTVKRNTEAQTAHCTVFTQVVNGTPSLSDAQVTAIIGAWDTSNPNRLGSGIYDQVRAVAGSEFSPGIDGDVKINLVFVNSATIGGTGLFGFFRPTAEFPKSAAASSNEGEILYLNADKFAQGDAFDIYSTMAHEFQHLVSFNNKAVRNGSYEGQGENIAIDEGRSVLIEDLTGYGLVSGDGLGGSGFIYTVVRDYLLDTTVAGLFQFPSSTSNAGYGRGYTFQRFLYDRVGETAYNAYSRRTETGLAGLNAAFGDFKQIYRDYTVALKASPLAGSVPANVKYTSNFNPSGTYSIRGRGTQTLPGVVPVKVSAPPQGTSAVSLPPWSFGAYEYTNGSGQTLTVNIQAGATADGNVVLENPRGTFTGLK